MNRVMHHTMTRRRSMMNRAVMHDMVNGSMVNLRHGRRRSREATHGNQTGNQ